MMKTEVKDFTKVEILAVGVVRGVAKKFAVHFQLVAAANYVEGQLTEVEARAVGDFLEVVYLEEEAHREAEEAVLRTLTTLSLKWMISPH